MGIEKVTLVPSDGVVDEQTGAQIGKALRTDVVTVHYKAFYVHGGKTKMYENTKGSWWMSLFGNNRKGAVTFEVGKGKDADIMTGLEVGIQKMTLGEKAKLGITSELMYAERGKHKKNGGKVIVPPNASILMEVELISIERKGNLYEAERQAGCFA